MDVSGLPVFQYLRSIYDRHLPDTSGTLASYIPELSRVDPNPFGVAFATTDGFVYEVGDTTRTFTIQSISKAVVYGLALEDHGRDAVLARIGVEPTGEAFNSITFDERNNRPFNPMVNAGAIAATSLIKGSDRAERMARISDVFRRMAGRELAMDEAVYRSESATGHRNRAIAFLELNFGMIEGDVEDHLDLYFRQCSLLVNTVDLAIIGATLANGGVNPVTGQRALNSDNVRSVLSVMNTCGMYDYAGGWQFDVGLPAKSGVGGGIAAVLPGRLGIGVYSPRLDAVGNSVRGVKVCEDVSRDFRLHLFEDRGSARLPVRRFYRGTDVRSTRLRRPSEVQVLDHDGYVIGVCELQGDLSFAELELISRRMAGELSSLLYVIFDLSRLGRVDAIGRELLSMMRRNFAADGKVFAVVSRDAGLMALAGENAFPTADMALEHFENQLLQRMGMAVLSEEAEVPLGGFSLFADWEADRLADLSGYLTHLPFAAGERLIATDTPARQLYFLTAGRVEVRLALADGSAQRLSTVDPGNVFGELALFGQARRSADIVATLAGAVMELDEVAFLRMQSERPAVALSLALAVGQSLAERLRRTTSQVLALSR